MTLFVHEIKRGWKALTIWAASVCGLMLICLMLFPEMKAQMSGLTDMFARMGAFTAAFGMDRISFASPLGFYGIECGNILGLGGAMYAALLGAAALGGEEAGHTAEFLLTHPVRRGRVAAEKLLAVLMQVLLLNLLALLTGCLGFLAVGENVSAADFLRMHAAWLAMQLELACLGFGLSPFLRGGLGASMGLSLGLYFLSIAANISEKAAFLRWISPFSYCEAASVLSDGHLDAALLAVGLAYALTCACIGWQRFARKDICG